MKNLIIGLILLTTYSMTAQVDDETLVQQTIETFFEGFHNQDKAVLELVALPEMTLRSISKDENNAMQISEATNFEDFTASILSIPESDTFEERILNFKILIDGAMAVAWTPYEFYFNGEFSHCGVNNFTLFKGNGNWKVLSIIDTRQQEGCNAE